MTKLILADFQTSIGWELVEGVMKDRLGKREGAKMYRALIKWMSGQTCSPYGIYPSDLKSFLAHYPNKAPVYD